MNCHSQVSICVSSTISYVTARRARMDVAIASAAQVHRSSFAGASLRGSRFDAAVIEDCDLSRANLDARSGMLAVPPLHLAGGLADQCKLCGTASLRAIFADVAFQIPFASTAPTRIETSTQFHQCDLRGTSWSGRDLSRVAFIDCQLDGIHGDVTGLAEREDRAR